MSRLASLLAARDVVLMDGGMGSTVEDRGASVREALWGSMALLTETGRELNEAVHRDFRRAGAELLITNTHNASPESCRLLLASEDRAHIESGLREELAGLDEKDAALRLCRWVNGQAADSLRRACPDVDVALAACLASPKPPYATEGPGSDEIFAALGHQAEALRRQNLDLLVFELMTTPGDLDGTARLARELELEQVGIAIKFRPDGRTHAGLELSEVIERTAPARPIAYFVQCTPHDEVLPSLDLLLEAVGSDAAVGVYANDCRVWRDRRWHGERLAPEVYARSARAWEEHGARIIGGCCGTTPEHIAAVARVLNGG